MNLESFKGTDQGRSKKKLGISMHFSEIIPLALMHQSIPAVLTPGN